MFGISKVKIQKTEIHGLHVALFLQVSVSLERTLKNKSNKQQTQI